MLSCSGQSLHHNVDDDDEAVSRCKLVSCSHRPTTLRSSISFRSAPETPLTDGERQCVGRTSGSSESGSVVSPLHTFAGRATVVQHNSFNSYFRPALEQSRRRPLSPPPRSPRSPDQTPPDQPPPPPPLSSTKRRPLPSRSHSVFASSPPHRIYRKHTVRDASASKSTLSTRQRQPAVDGPRSPHGSSVGLAARRRSVYGHVSSGTAGVLPTRLGRRYTVVGGGTVDCPPPPIPLSLREIYRLSRRGSLHSRRNVHGRRQSTFSMLHSEKDGTCTPSKASVGISRYESGHRRRLPSSASERASVGDCDADDDVVDVRRRRSNVESVEQTQHLLLGSDQTPLSLLSLTTNHDNEGRDKTQIFSIILVSVLAFAFSIAQIPRITLITSDLLLTYFSLAHSW